MRRRTLLGITGAGVLAAVAGCNRREPETPTATPTPAPAASTLRIEVENTDDTDHDVIFRLKTQSPGFDVAEQFELEDIAPGSTRAIGPRELRKGSYELQIYLPQGAWTFRWAGYECPEKLFEIRLSDNGSRVADRCPDG